MHEYDDGDVKKEDSADLLDAAAGGARKSTASEMTGETARLGDVAIEVPSSGTATRGAAVGGGMSRSSADPQAPGTADPGGGSDLTADATADPTDTRGGDNPGAAPAGTETGGRLLEFDAAFKRRHERR